MDGWDMIKLCTLEFRKQTERYLEGIKRRLDTLSAEASEREDVQSIFMYENLGLLTVRRVANGQGKGHPLLLTSPPESIGEKRVNHPLIWIAFVCPVLPCMVDVAKMFEHFKGVREKALLRKLGVTYQELVRYQS